MYKNSNYSILVITSLSLSVCTFWLAKPGSITNTTPSIVNEVSAILVATTTFLPMAPLGRLQAHACDNRSCDY